DEIMVCEHISKRRPHDAEFIALANPANVLALIEALEKVQQRIAELESRTVKLPDLRQIVSGDRYVWSDGVYNYSQDVKVALAAAGIKVEAE
ncbi:ead/Ea22-like family protein, partial [Klebsiella pneumoniae]